MTKIKQLFLLVFAGTLLFSCKKEGDTIYEPATYRIKESAYHKLGLAPTTKDTYTYDGDKLTLKESYKHIAGEWTKDSELRFTYDGNKVIAEGYNSDDTTGSPAIVVETIVENNKAVEILKYEFVDDEKTLTEKEIYNYDGDNLMEILWFDIRDNYVDNEIVTELDTVNYRKYFYENGTLVRCEYRESSYGGVNWDIVDSSLYTYKDGKEIRTSYDPYSSDLLSKTESTYLEGELLHSYLYEWDEVSNTWNEQGYSKNTTQYSKSSKRVEFEYRSGETSFDYSRETTYELGSGNANLFLNTIIYDF